MSVLGFYEVLIKSIDFCEICVPCQKKKKKKKEWRSKQERESCALALIPEVEECLGKLLMITLYVLLPLTI